MMLTGEVHKFLFLMFLLGWSNFLYCFVGFRSSTQLRDRRSHFLSDIPISLQNIIEQRNRTEILQWINNRPSTAQLLAVPDTTIGHTSVFEDSSFKPCNIEISSIGQQSMAEIGIIERGFRQIGTSQIDVAEIGLYHIALEKKNLSQISMTEISPFTSSIFQISSAQISPTQVSKTKVRQVYPSITEIGIFKNNVRDIDITQTSTGHFDSRKVSFASSIPSKQFFSIHNSPEIINNLNNTATNIWSNLLQTETQLDITFQITDLPTGELAEATITGFDPFGRPNAGTILIDYNANGIGWFIDPTPLENSEFEIRSSEFSYNATPNSDAYGKYDLLTTLLHEIAHLYGFIEGYEPFDHLHYDQVTIYRNSC